MINLGFEICEVLSPGTVRIDRIRKMPVYAKSGIQHAWLVDPIERTLEVYRLEAGKWALFSVHSENDHVRAELFQEIEIDLEYLWWK